jgi:hypothetical protein
VTLDEDENAGRSRGADLNALWYLDQDGGDREAMDDSTPPQQAGDNEPANGEHGYMPGNGIKYSLLKKDRNLCTRQELEEIRWVNWAWRLIG